MRNLALTLLTLVAVFVLPAAAQKRDKDKEDANTRSLQGVVTNSADQPVEGAVVQLKDTKTLQIRSFITKEGGTYYFYRLNPDIDYEIRAEHQGQTSGSKVLSAFDGRKQAVVNLKINK